MSQRVGAKRRPMTGSAICGSDVAGAVGAKIPDIAALIRATPASVRRNATRFSHPESVRCARVVRNISYNSQFSRPLYFRARMNDQRRLNV
jgi:hypothetical protein